MRPILRMLGSRYGMALVLAVLVIGVVAVTRTFLGSNPADDAAPFLPPITESAPASVGPTLGDDSEFEPSEDPAAPGVSLSPGGPEPTVVATRFLAAWLKHTGVTAAQWRAGMTPHATPALMAKFKDTDPSGVPASRATGTMRVETRSAAVVEALTTVDSGTVRLRLIPVAGVWKVDGVDWGRT